MTYQETIEYLYQQLPVFHRVGKKAYKADLNNTLLLCEHLGNPQEKFNSIHIAGTNGKGSSSHYLASILQSAGYKTGLYTSPHLKSFTERIRINGFSIPENEVISFVESNNKFLEKLKPSFFEMSVGMAFEYFAKEQVDVAIIEVGLGGRLDSTNVITPLLSLITNISFDHTDILGDTLPKIAFEKAGIIKPNIPVVISERDTETESVFIEKARIEQAPIYFAEDYFKIQNSAEKNLHLEMSIFDILNKQNFIIESQLLGIYQTKNILGVLKSVDILNSLNFRISSGAIFEGVKNVISQTGLQGRWQVLSKNPLMICDTAHNLAGITQVIYSLEKINYNKLWMIIGFVSDKDISGILKLLPKQANYIFCEAKIPRALKSKELLMQSEEHGLVGEEIPDVNNAIDFVLSITNSDDLIYIGGSTFVVAEISERFFTLKY
jgi:dihydrofolate synthase / folylpolyglutamate synthase